MRTVDTIEELSRLRLRFAHLRDEKGHNWFWNGSERRWITHRPYIMMRTTTSLFDTYGPRFEVIHPGRDVLLEEIREYFYAECDIDGYGDEGAGYDWDEFVTYLRKVDWS